MVNFTNNLTTKLHMPGLRLSVLAKILIFITLLIMIILFFSIGEELIHLKLSGVDPGYLLAFFSMPIGLIIHFGLVRLPGKTVEDLIGKIIEINALDLLSEERKNLKELLSNQLSSAYN